ncbi:MAG: hypothetical protein P9L94_02045 [Candidatus Hinthialibacter antarcticus]|nr:hypothetical protein [Candidatus Hinthialibacter antarcticus]
MKIRFWLCLVVFCTSSFIAAAQETPTSQLLVSFEEINSASPIVSHATMTVALAKAFVNAMPDKWSAEIKDSGFDLATITTLVESLRVDDSIENESEKYRLEVVKKNLPKDANAAPGYLVIHSNKLRLPVPLLVTSVAVGAIQLAFRDFKDKQAELTALVEEIKQSPKGMLYDQHDVYDGSWLRLSLE